MRTWSSNSYPVATAIDLFRHLLCWLVWSDIYSYEQVWISNTVLLVRGLYSNTGYGQHVYLQYDGIRLLVGKPERKIPIERPRRRWVNNIKMDLGEIGGGGARGIILVKAICYNLEFRGWMNIFNLPNPSGRTRLRSLLSLWQKWVPEREK
jgi:hypothetical protein